jgi:hypothetical protein
VESRELRVVYVFPIKIAFSMLNMLTIVETFKQKQTLISMILLKPGIIQIANGIREFFD